MTERNEDAAAVAAGLRSVLLSYRAIELQLAKTLGVNGTDMSTLEIVGRLGGATPTQVGEHVGISSGAVTFSVDRLAAAGHLERHPHPSDRRKTLLALTPDTARRVAAELGPLQTALMALAGGRTPEEQRTIADFLAEADEAIRAVARDGD